MTTTELIKLLKKYEFGGATGRPREVSFQINNGIIGTDDIEVVGTGDGLVTELFLSLPSAEWREDEWCKDCKEYDQEKHCCPRFNRVIRETLDEVEEQKTEKRMLHKEYKWLGDHDEYTCPSCKMTFKHLGALRFCPNCGIKFNGIINVGGDTDE